MQFNTLEKNKKNSDSLKYCLTPSAYLFETIHKYRWGEGVQCRPMGLLYIHNVQSSVVTSFAWRRGWTRRRLDCTCWRTGRGYRGRSPSSRSPSGSSGILFQQPPTTLKQYLISYSFSFISESERVLRDCFPTASNRPEAMFN